MTEERKSENALRKPRVDVVIPTYKPGKKFSRLLKMLEKQTYPIGKIIVMNTEKAFWNEKGFEGISNLQVHHLTKVNLTMVPQETGECVFHGLILWCL